MVSRGAPASHEEIDFSAMRSKCLAPELEGLEGPDLRITLDLGVYIHLYMYTRNDLSSRCVWWREKKKGG